jgi:hypothetical protein
MTVRSARRSHPAAVEYNIVDRLGLVNAEVVDTLDERTRGGA